MAKAKIRGPLGFWPFPIINFILGFSDEGLLAGLRGWNQSQSKPLSLSAENVEKWELQRDKTGRLQTLTVHRELKEGG